MDLCGSQVFPKTRIKSKPIGTKAPCLRKVNAKEISYDVKSIKPQIEQKAGLYLLKQKVPLSLCKSADLRQNPTGKSAHSRSFGDEIQKTI